MGDLDGALDQACGTSATRLPLAFTEDGASHPACGRGFASAAQPRLHLGAMSRVLHAHLLASFLVLPWALLALLGGCSTVSVVVPVVRPAEIDLRGKREVVIGMISGDHGPELESVIKVRIDKSGYFKLVDRAHLDTVLQELHLGASGHAETSGESRLGRLITGAVLIAGSVDRREYSERVERSGEGCTQTSEGTSTNDDCSKSTRLGHVSMIVAFDIVDIATRENLKPKRFECVRDDSTDAQDGPPPAIDARALFDQCSTEIVDRFMRAIVPWVEQETVEFAKHGDLPSMEVGIRNAEVGRWPEAIDAFQEAVARAETLPELKPKDRAKAHRNLGLAYVYTSNFSGAIEQLQKAYEMSAEPEDLARITHVRLLDAERRALDNPRSNVASPELR